MRRACVSRHSGGVCIYVRIDLAFIQIDELSHEEFKAALIKLLLYMVLFTE